MKKPLALIFILLLFASFQAFADTTFYVDASGGNDNNNGLSPSSAWRTLSKVSGRAYSSGDMILFKRGEVWRESLIIDRSSGNANKPIVYGAFGYGPKPQINGSTRETGWELSTGSIYRKTFTNEPRVVTQDGNLLVHRRWEGSVGDTFSGASPGCFSVRKSDNRVFVWCTNSADPDTHQMEVSAKSGENRYGILIKSVHYIVVENLDVRQSTNVGIWIRARAREDASNIIVRKCDVSKSGSVGIEISNGDNMNGNNPIFDCIITGNSSFENRTHGICLTFHVIDCVVSHNVVYDNSWDEDECWHGISQWSSDDIARPTRNIIEHNEVYRTKVASWLTREGTGIQCDMNTYYSIIRNNNVHDNGGCGIMINYSYDCEVYYNLCIRNGTAPGDLWGGVYSLRSVRTKIYNNVLYKNNPNGLLVGGDDDRGTQVKNNIFVENADYEVRVFPAAGTNYQGDYNLYNHPDGNNFMRWATSSYSLSNWRSNTGDDSHSIETAPRFIWTAENPFALSPNSACIDSGTDVGLSEDYVGNPVPVGQGVDIGAYEYGREDLLGTWLGDGVYYQDLETGIWYRISPPATGISAGDIDGSNFDDLLGIWSDGVWVKYSATGTWAKLCSDIPSDIATADMDGDGWDDLVGSWSSGIYYRDSRDGIWIRMATSVPNQRVAASDLDGDGAADLIGDWSDGVWIKYSSSNSWARVASVARDLAAGDMNGDGIDDLLGTWDGQGVFYLDSANGTWIKMAAPGNLVAAGELDADAVDDVILVQSDGLWVRYSETGEWLRITGNKPEDIDAGTFADGVPWTLLGKAPPTQVNIAEYLTQPQDFQGYADFSDEGPLGWNFRFEEQWNTFPEDRFSFMMMRQPGPGDPGFVFIEQDSIIPQNTQKKRDIN